LVYIPADKALRETLAAASATEGLHTVVGTVASGDLFVAKNEDKARIKSLFNAAACEMEGASIGQVAYTNGVPFAVLRAISDGGDGMEFSEFAPLAATRSVKVTREFVKRLGE
jgi:adenosylhomocysteine nucleosidase